MALLVKERKALEKLEQSFETYFKSICMENLEDLGIDSTKTPEERILYLSVLLDTAI